MSRKKQLHLEGEAEELVFVLTELVRLKHELRERTRSQRGPIVAMSAAEILSKPLPPKSAADIVVEAIQAIGQRLFDIVGSTDKLEDIAESVADRVSPDYPLGISRDIMSKGFDGVGNDKDRWWA